MGAGMYTVRVIGELDSTRIRAELARISKTPLRVNGALGGIGVSAGKATKGVKGLNGQLIQTNKNIKKLNGKNLNSVASASEKSAKGMKSFGAETLGVTKKVVQFGAITAIIRGVTSGMGDMVKNVYELDGALTEFRKVSDLSGKGLEKYTDQAYKVGKTVARTGTEMIQAATEFKKSGFNEKDSLELGRVASMYQNVADVEISAGEAANFIVSQMKAFNMTAGDAEHIIDAVNQVSNNFAVSSADIATNIGKASAAMATGNVTYEQSVGLMTAMTEITRNGAKSARGLVSIQSRYNQIVDESSSTGKKLTAWYKEHNIAIKDQNGQLRSFYEVGADVAKIWDTLSDNEKRYYLNTQAGANQSQNLAALMRNYETAIDATNTALNSAGSAAKENSRYMDSMEGKLEALSSAWENFSRKIVNSDWLKKGMDVLTDILEALSTDVGQTIIKYGLIFTGVATGLNLIAKAGMALKGLSLVKLFSGIGKEARLAGGLIGETAVKSSKLDKVFSLLLTDTAAWAIGIAGASAAISAGLIVYDKYMQKHDAFAKSEAEDIKATKEYKKATEDLVKIRERLQGVQSEIEQLKQKREAGTLTETEKKRLDLLLEQENSLKRQLELQEKLIRHKFEDSEKKLGKSGLTSTDFANGRGKTAQEIWADKGVHNEADKAVYLYNKKLKDTISLKNKAKKAQDDYDEALRKGKATQDELDDLEKKATQAQKAYEDSQYDTLQTLDSLYNKKKEYLDVYGDEKSIPEELKGSYKKLNKVIRDNENLMDVSIDDINGGMKAIKKYGKSMGVIVDDANKIDKVDLGNFNQSMTNAGKSADDVLTYLQEIAAENPDVTFTLDGSEYTIDQLTVVDGQLQTLDGTVVTTTLDAKDNVTPKEQEIKGHRNLGKATKMLGEKGGHKVNTTMRDLEKKNSLGKATKKINQKGANSVERKLGSIAARNNLGTAIKSIHFSLSGAVGAAKKFLGLKKGIKHFASGGQNDKPSIFPNAEVNEQGFEIIQDAKTGLMRVANGGKRGVTRLNSGDTVYTHGQSVRMLQRAGSSEGKLIYGHNRDDIGLFGIGKLPGFKKGKDKKKEKLKKAQKKYNKQYNAIVSAYDKALSTLEYKRDTQHWSEKTFITKYNALQKKYNKKIKALNKKKTVSGVKKKKSLGTDRLRAYGSAKSDYKHTQATENISEWIEGHVFTNDNLSYALKKIQDAKKAKKISAEEAEQYRKEAYKKHLEYNLKRYENDKKSFKDSLALIKSYYDKARISAEEYYQYREELAKNQLEKEKKRLTEQQTLTTNTYDLARSYVQRQIDLLEEENDEQKEQNELVELQNNLAKARNTRIRIYKEGEGFVYEQDTQAIKEATESLKEYQKTAENPVLNKWKEVLKLFDRYETDFALRNLENQVGATVGQLFGALGTDTSAWAAWIKNNLSTSYGLQNVLDNMDKLVDTNDILNYLNGNGQVPNAIVQSAIANNILPSTYAAAITQAALASGSVIGSGIGISQQSSIASATSGTSVGGTLLKSGNVYNFENLVLPNVTKPTEFINELNSLSTTALQVSTQRV